MMFGTSKRVLNSHLHQQMLDDDGLHSVMCEVEAILRDCSITKLSDDPNNSEPLTPNHLLLLKGKPALPPGLLWNLTCMWNGDENRFNNSLICFGSDGSGSALKTEVERKEEEPSCWRCSISHGFLSSTWFLDSWQSVGGFSLQKGPSAPC